MGEYRVFPAWTAFTLKSLLVFIILTCAAPGFSFAQKVYSINDFPLSWSNFTKKNVAIRSRAAALTYVNINMEYELVPRQGQTELTISLRLTQIKSKSWVSTQFLKRATDQESEALLNHEKVHVILNYIALRKMYEQMNNTEYTKDYKSEIAGIFLDVNRECERRNSDYDRMTVHGTNKEAQKEWEELALDELNNLYTKGEKLQEEYIIRKVIKN